MLVIVSCSNKNAKEVRSYINHKDSTSTIHVEIDSQFDARKTETIIDPYDFDTILKNNFHLSYRVYSDTISNEKLQSLTLVKGKKDIRQISETSFPMLHKNLGYIGADFGSTFLFVQSFGSGNPHEIQLIEKESGKILKEGVLVDVNEKEGILLYIKNEHQETQKLLLLDLKTNKEKTINDFNILEYKRIGGLRDIVVIDTVTRSEIVLKSNFDENNSIKRIKR